MDHIEKLLRRVPPKHRTQLLRALECLEDESCRARLRAEKLAGTTSGFKVHAGRYRIIFTVQHSTVGIVDIRLRNERTYRDI